jgi:hypothetical protein
MFEESLIPLALHLSPGHLWERAMGYWGDARFIGVYQDCGRAYYSDGRLTATASWAAFACFTHHPYARVILRDFPALTEDEKGVAALWLVIDTRRQRLYVAPRQAAMTLLAQQWPQSPGEQAVLIYETGDELMELAAEVIRQHEAEQQRHEREQREALAGLGMWLELQMSSN